MELIEGIQTGNVPLLQSFLKDNQKWNVNSRHGRDEFSLLHWACHFGALEVAYFLSVCAVVLTPVSQCDMTLE